MASAKTKTLWFCTNCGNEYSKWMGRCPACGEWNTMAEREVVTGSSKATPLTSASGSARKPMRLKDVSTTVEDRL